MTNNRYNLRQRKNLNYSENKNNKRKTESIETCENKKIKLDSKSSSKMESNILFEMGNKFENMVFDNLKQRYGSLVKKVCYTTEDMKNKTLCKFTKKYMEQGYPFIIQAMLVNNNNNTFGVADLLVRSDFINNLTNNKILETNLINYRAKLLDGNYHYLVIDIKWSTMNLTANETNILNQNRYNAYKGQLAVYNLALGLMQGYIPDCAYILAKEWRCKSKDTKNFNCFDKLGVIDYANFDKKYIELTANAVNWIREVRTNGNNWSCYEPEREEMCPNMTINNNKWNSVKNEIASHNKELTLLWMVGQKNRQYANDNDVYKWDDKKCSSSTLNLKGKIGDIVDKLIEINNSDDKLIFPDIITNNDYGWQKEGKLDFFVDFETLNECFIKKEMTLNNSKTNTNMIFMISIQYKENGKYSTKTFKTNDKSFDIQKERYILDEFKKFIENKAKKLKSPIKFFHWSQAEYNFLNNANKRHFGIYSDFINKIKFVDVCKIFTNEPIVVKNMFNFKLKEVANAFRSHGLIKTQWDDNIDNGFVAMMKASNYYANKDDNKKIIDDISEYNKNDCVVLWEIVDYLRKHHCK